MWVIVIVLIVIVLWQFTKNSKHNEQIEPTAKETQSEETPIGLDFKNAYQSKWLFSYNEKDAFVKLKALTDKHGLILLSKVRLLDLLEPIKGNPKYKTYFYKVQSKHVDFVICDAKLVARCIIELDDNSHNTEKRKARDNFVDTVAESVGYKILHVRAISENEIEPTIKEIFKIEEKGE